MTFTLLLATTALLTVFYFKSDAVRFGVKSDSGEAVQVAQYSPSEGYQLPPIGSPVPSPVFPNPTSDANLPVRKNAVDLTPQEKAAFVRAIDTLKNTIPEGSPISVYDQLALKHVLVMGCEVNFAGSGPAHGFNHAHGLPAFLPWHRQLVREFEQGLQAIDPNVTVPYWDWTDPKALDVILRDDFLGTNGTGVKVEIPGVGTVEGRPVPSSPFADWTLNEAIHIEPINLSSMGPKLLRFAEVPPLSRSFITPEAVKQLFTIDNYEIFSNLLEGDHSLTPDGQIVEDRRLHSYAHALAGGAFVKLAIDLLETAVDIQVETPSSPLWQRIRQLCLHRANPICRLSQEVVSIWLEFDLEQEHSNLPIPSIFLSLQEGQFQYLNGDTPTFCCWLTEKAIEPLLGHTVPFRLQQNFRSCLEALPITAQVLYLGVLLPQQSETIRIYISGISPLKLVEYLTQIGWLGPISKVAAIALELQNLVHRIVLKLDFGVAVAPTLGFECFTNPRFHGNTQWLPLLNYLVSNQLCTPEKRRSLLNWSGCCNEQYSPVYWPQKLAIASDFLGEIASSIMVRDLNHIELFFRSENKLEAKASLWFGSDYNIP